MLRALPPERPFLGMAAFLPVKCSHPNINAWDPVRANRIPYRLGVLTK